MRNILSGFFCLVWLHVSAQSVFVPYQSDYYHLINRYAIRYGHLSARQFTATMPYERQQVAHFADAVAQDSTIKLSKQDLFNLAYLQNDNWEWSTYANNDSRKPVFNYFYRKKSDLIHHHDTDFDLHVNPVLYFQAGKDNQSDKTPYINTRGAEIRGSINNKVGFYTFVGENQALFPSYVSKYIDSTTGAIPGEAFIKSFKQEEAYDFITARGYITFNATKHIHLQFGQDRNFIGNGYRSLVLSDFGTSYPFLKINTRVWKLEYTNLFAQMKAGRQFAGDQYIPNKYFAFHRLGIDLGRKFNIGLFESIVFARKDSTGGSFDIAYLNPIIFYRAAEQYAGSPDNANLGLDFRWYIHNRFSLYGQLMIDEFLLNNVKAGKGWWGNKQAGQLGLHYIDVAGIRNLDLQAEVNIVRPFTYSHKDNFTNYTHYAQALAHPLGANFYESIAIVRYQPMPRLMLTGKYFYIKAGEDSPRANWGGNIFKDYNTRTQDFDNRIAQGVAARILFTDLTASLQLRHNLFVDLKQVVRQKDSDMDSRDQTTYFTSLAVRLNIMQRLQEY